MIIEKSYFLETVKKNIKVKNEDLLSKAYDFASDAHKNQKRDGGAPYFVHPLEIAIIISEFKLDENSVIAGLLHDVVEDTQYELKDIEKLFGEEIAYLVNGLTKIENVQFKSQTEKNAENFRKLILSTAKDIRVLIIKLIDRLHNIRTLNGISDPNRRQRIANETIMIYIPLAERIGMYKLKLELEDLCFKELFPLEREEIIKNIKKAKRNKKNVIEDIVKKLNMQLNFEAKINCKIKGREKRPYSVWKKMHKKSISFEKLLDIIAFRIITKDLQDCYKVLGFINSNYVMVPDTFKDYISKPKINGYQSLHMVIIGPKNVKMEIQIRTESMDRINEYGVASHWMYKQNIKESDNWKEYNFIKKLVQNIENMDYDAENYEDLKFEFSEDEIFCYTPKGDIINLPIGSTGIDFAYAIHRDVGNKASGVKINGVLSQFKTTLKSGDEVEILTSKTAQVNDEWLNFVKTAKAKGEIKVYIRNSRQKEFEKIGREDVENINKEFKINITDELIEKNIINFKMGKTPEEIYRLIAEGKIKKKELVNAIYPDFEKEEKLSDEQILTKIKINQTSNTDNLGIQGLDKNTAYKYAKCCYPIPPEEIVGVVNSGIGITVHKKNCQTLKNIENERIIYLDWNTNEINKYIAKMVISMDSIPGIFAKVINACAEKKINIIAVSTLNESELYQEVELKIEVKNSKELEHFKAYLRSVKGIIDIR